MGGLRGVRFVRTSSRPERRRRPESMIQIARPVLSLLERYRLSRTSLRTIHFRRLLSDRRYPLALHPRYGLVGCHGRRRDRFGYTGGGLAYGAPRCPVRSYFLLARERRRRSESRAWSRDQPSHYWKGTGCRGPVSELYTFGGSFPIVDTRSHSTFGTVSSALAVVGRIASALRTVVFVRGSAGSGSFVLFTRPRTAATDGEPGPGQETCPLTIGKVPVVEDQSQNYTLSSIVHRRARARLSKEVDDHFGSPDGGRLSRSRFLVGLRGRRKDRFG